MRALAALVLFAAATSPANAQERTPAGGGSTVREVPPAVQAPLITAVPEAGPVGDSSGRLVLELLSEQGEGELLSSDLVGRPLYGRDGRKLGEITDLLVDRNRRLVAVVAALDAGAGPQGKSIGIPFDALRRSGAGGQEVRLVVDIDEGRLREAKAFEALSKEAGQDDSQDLTAKGGAATGVSIPPAAR